MLEIWRIKIPGDCAMLHIYSVLQSPSCVATANDMPQGKGEKRARQQHKPIGVLAPTYVMSKLIDAR